MVYGSDIYEKRKHVHISYAQSGFKRACKFWLEPVIELDENKKGNFTVKELGEIKKLIEENKEILMEQLELFYKHQQVKAIRK